MQPQSLNKVCWERLSTQVTPKTIQAERDTSNNNVGNTVRGRKGL